MSSEKPNAAPKALVTVFDDLKTASDVIHALVASGFPHSRIEVVTYNVQDQAHDVSTPKVHDTTMSSLESGMGKGAGIGAAAGAAGGVIAALATAFPGIIIGTVLMGTLVGGFVGGISGIERADADDSVNLPTVEEYNELLDNGKKLVVVHGSHSEVERAKEIVKSMLHVSSHIHLIHGHEFHEHS